MHVHDADSFPLLVVGWGGKKGHVEASSSKKKGRKHQKRKDFIRVSGELTRRKEMQHAWIINRWTLVSSTRVTRV